MRTKALLLAAQPPSMGPWVSISEGDSWIVDTQVRPGVPMNGALTIEVMDNVGVVTIDRDGVLKGSYARAILGTVEGAESVSVYIEEAQDADP